MKILIIGLAKTGQGMIKGILDENHEVTVIDKSKSAIEEATNKYNISGFCGSGASRKVLLKAGVADADIVIAATETDEVNLMCSMIAKSLGAHYVVAVLRNPDFEHEREYIKSQFGISYIINPELDTANEIANLIRFPVSLKAEAFFANDITIAEIPVEAKMEIDGISISDLRAKLASEMLVCSVKRGKNAYVPDGSFVLKSGDVLDVIISHSTLNQICEKLGIIKKNVKSVMIVGGGNTGLYLAKKLCEMKMKVKIVEFDKKRCSELVAELPHAEVVHGDGLESGLLMEEGIKNYDACVSLTGADESNLVAAMFAWSCGIHPIITKIVSPSYAELLKGVSIDYTVSPSAVSMKNLLRYIRIMENCTCCKKGDINALNKLGDGSVEAIEFCADESFASLGVPFKDFSPSIKDNTLVAAIIRNDNVIIPDKDSTIELNDKVIIVTLCGNKYHTLSDILKTK